MTNNKKLWTAPDGKQYPQIYCQHDPEMKQVVLRLAYPEVDDPDFSEVDLYLKQFIDSKTLLQCEEYLQKLTRAIVKLARQK